MNTILLIGKILNFNEKDGHNSSFTLQVERPFQENDGSFKDDRFLVQTWKGVCDQIKENYKPCDMVAVKGRLAEGEHHSTVIFAEKVTLIM